MADNQILTTLKVLGLDKVAADLTNLASKGAQSFAQLGQAAQQAAQGGLNQFAQAMQRLAQAANDQGLRQAGQGLTQLGQAAGQAASGGLAQFRTAFQQIGQASTGQIFNQLRQGLQQVGTEAARVASGGFQQLRQGLTQLTTAAGASIFNSLRSALQQVGQAAAQAASTGFERLRSAVSTVRDAMSQAAGAFSSVGQALGNAFRPVGDAIGNVLRQVALLGTAATGLSAVFGGGLVAGILAFARAGNLSAEAMGDLAEQLGETQADASTLVSSFAAGGVAAEQLETIFKRLAVSTEKAWQDIKKATEDGVRAEQQAKQAVDSASQSMVEAHANVAKAAQERRRASEDLARIERDISNNFRDNALDERGAVLSLEEAEENLREVRLRRAQGDATALQVRRAELNVERAKAALDDARLKREREFEEAARKREDAINRVAEAARNEQRAMLQAEAAQTQLDEAQQKRTEQQRNDIRNITKAVEDTVRGIPDATRNINDNVDNMAKGIVAAAARGQRGFEGLTQGIQTLGDQPPKATRVLETLADVLKNTESPAKRMALAVEILGRGVSQDLVAFLSQGSEALRAHRAELAAAGLTYTEEGKKIADAFKVSSALLENDLRIVRDKLALTFGPGATALMDAFRTAIVKNFPAIEAEVKKVANVFNQFAQAFANILTGVSGDDFASQMAEQARRAGKEVDQEFVDGVLAWQRTLSEFFEFVRRTWTQIKEFFTKVDLETGLTGFEQSAQSVLRILNLIAEAINKVFGTSLDGKTLGMAALIGEVTGVNRVIRETITVVGQFAFALGIIAALISPGAAIIVGLGLLAAALIIAKGGFEEVNTAIDKYNQQSYAEATKNAEKHFEQVRKDIDSLIEKLVGPEFKNAVSNYNKEALDTSRARMEQHTKDVQADLEKIKQFFSDAWDKIKEIVRDGVAAVSQAVPDELKKVAGLIFDAVVAPFKAAFEFIQRLFGGLADMIKRALGGVPQAAKDTAKETRDAVQDIPRAAEEGTQGIGDRLRDGFGDATKAAQDFGKELAGAARTASENVQQAGQSGIQVIRGLSQGFQQAGESSIQVLRGMGPATQDFLNSVNRLPQATGNAVDNVVQDFGRVGKSFNVFGDNRLQRGAENLASRMNDIASNVKKFRDNFDFDPEKSANNLNQITNRANALKEMLGELGGEAIRQQGNLDRLWNDLLRTGRGSSADLQRLRDDYDKIIEGERVWQEELDRIKQKVQESAAGLDDYGERARDAFQKPQRAASDLGDAIDNSISKLQRAGQPADQIASGLDKVASEAAQIGPALNQAAQATTGLEQGLSNLGQIAQQAFEQIKNEASQLGQSLSQVLRGGDDEGKGSSPFQTLIQQIEELKQSLQSIGEGASTAFQQIAEAATGVFDGILEQVRQFPEQVRSALSGLASIITSPFQEAERAITPILERLLQLINDVISGAARARDEAGQGATQNFTGGGGGGGGGSGFSAGGRIYGPGGPTSDRVPIWASAGEWVIRAKAVRALIRQFGSGIMHAINRGMLPVPGFSMGGMAQALAASSRPRSFARGGLVDGGARGGHLGTLTFADGQGREIATVFASQDTARVLHDYAIKSVLKSGGRKPSSYRG